MGAVELHAWPARVAVQAFATEVGATGPVTCVGGRTHAHAASPVDPAAREVRAPAGVVEHQPEELIVRCGAGTTVAELASVLARRGQMCPLDPAEPQRATVGGVLAMGWSGLRRLRYGPVRDLLLEAQYVSADGLVVKAGAPVVKNVTGYDLCRLLVGSQGTLGFLADVVLRCRPAPAASTWVDAGGADPFALRSAVWGAAAVLWDGTRSWIGLEGSAADVREGLEAIRRATGAEGIEVNEVAGPPALPGGGRLSVDPALLRARTWEATSGPWLAEVGVGTVHVHTPPAPRPPANAALQRAVKAAFDPSGRLNPERRR